jgi:hypothetical protein
LEGPTSFHFDWFYKLLCNDLTASTLVQGVHGEVVDTLWFPGLDLKHIIWDERHKSFCFWSLQIMAPDWLIG